MENTDQEISDLRSRKTDPCHIYKSIKHGGFQIALCSRMDKLDRGTVVYMAPEILLPEKQPSRASMGDLMLCDTWYDNFHNDKPMSEMSLPIQN